jgi:hypothetical protein
VPLPDCKSSSEDSEEEDEYKLSSSVTIHPRIDPYDENSTTLGSIDTFSPAIE